MIARDQKRETEMAISAESTEVGAFFSNQMLIHLVRNLVANGLINADGIRANIHETIDQGTVHYDSPQYHELLAGYAAVYESAVNRGLSLRK
jgi:hypothetical protein